MRLFLKKEHTNWEFKKFNERPVEYRFVFDMVSRYYPKTLLDVGTGTTSLPHLLRTCGVKVKAIDNIKDYWPNGMFNRHFYVINDDILDPHMPEKFDMITCISVLEHIPEFDLAIKNMVQLLNKGGFLVITCPSSPLPYVENCYALPDSSYGKNSKYVTQSFSPETIENWCEKYKLEIVETEYWKFWSGDYWTCGKQIIPPLKSNDNESYQIRCIAFKKL